MRSVSALVGLVLATSGCTVITVEHPDGAVERRYGFGTVALRVESDHRAQLVTMRGLGFTSLPHTTAAGFYAAKLAMIGPECRIVLWVEEDEQLRELAAFLRGHPDACARTGSIMGE